ncbi:MAG TPA: hypothetical protein PK876_10990 [Elusimicrobiota bacterium]|nr:hypothetical protein [Elusimicrobiota bacterium]
MRQVLIIAPTPSVRDYLVNVSQQAGIVAEGIESYPAGIAQLEKDPPVLVVLENPLKDEDISKLTESLRLHAPVTPFIVYLPERNGELALRRMAQGAYDCLVPPVSAGDFLAAGKRAVSRVGRRLITDKTLLPPAWWRRPSLYVYAFLAMMAVLLGTGLYQWFTSTYRVYRLSSEHPTAVCGVQNEVWVTDWFQQILSRFRVKGGYLALEDMVKWGDFQPVAVAAAPYYVYTASADGHIRRHRRDENLPVVASVSSPGSAPSGLTWDGKTLWSCDSDTKKVYEHDNQLGVKNSFECPAQVPVGLAWHKDTLWIADGGDLPVLWRMVYKGSGFSSDGPYPLTIARKYKDLKISGFTIWKGRAWLVNETGRVLIQHKMPKGKN